MKCFNQLVSSSATTKKKHSYCTDVQSPPADDDSTTINLKFVENFFCQLLRTMGIILFSVSLCRSSGETQKHTPNRLPCKSWGHRSTDRGRGLRGAMPIAEEEEEEAVVVAQSYKQFPRSNSLTDTVPNLFFTRIRGR